MTDLLEKTILENKEAFEEESIDGHFDRFEAKLDKMHSPKTNWGWKTYLQIAASVLLIVLATNQAFIHFGTETAKPLSLSQIAPEYSEVEFYFTSSIENNMHEWDKLVGEGFINEEEQEMMNSEIQEFDKMYEELQTELQANPDDERVINSMLEYYQAKLSIITLIIDKLQEVKQQKISKNEIEI